MFKVSNNKILDYLKSWLGNEPEDGDISPKEAAEIQHQSFLEEAKISEKSCTPPYLQIAKQLESNKIQVFEAAVFYLTTIASLETKYKKPIMHILNSYIEENPTLKERVAYIEKMAEKYKLLLSAPSNQDIHTLK